MAVTQSSYPDNIPIGINGHPVQVESKDIFSICR